MPVGDDSNWLVALRVMQRFVQQNTASHGVPLKRANCSGR